MLYENRVSKKREQDFAGEYCVLGIETSCDDTSAAIVVNGRECLSLSINSQIPIHRRFGGIVPEIASRNHVLNLAPVVEDALEKAGKTAGDIDCIAVTSAPGLLGALLTGVNFAKGLSFAIDAPLISVNHIEAHICANFITYKELEPPFLCLVASGGHSQVILVKDYCEYELLGGTCDDAAGEALDKIARALGLPYPGGVYLEKLAVDGNEDAYGFRSQFNTNNNPNFSFSGIKTAVINVLNTAEENGEKVNPADVAASFQRAVTDTLIHKTLIAAKEQKINKIVLAGGVSANTRLRTMLTQRGTQQGCEVFCPDMQFCGDNGAMVASAGYFRSLKGKFAGLALDARATAEL